jgi:ATP-dependent Lon protease
MWGVVELVHTQEGITLSDFRPMQATVNLQLYKEARHQFTLDEWRELMLMSMGYNPEAFNPDEQLLLLCRLLPLVQKNMHMIELAPKGTGKSYIYENVGDSLRLSQTSILWRKQRNFLLDMRTFLCRKSRQVYALQ